MQKTDMDFLVKSQGSQVGTNYQGKSENLGMRQIIHGLFSLFQFLLHQATLAMTKIVLTTEAISRTAQYSEMIPKEFISLHRQERRIIHVLGKNRGKTFHLFRFYFLERKG